MKKKVVWGTGCLASKFMHSAKSKEIDFFIDSNKKNDVFFNRPVYKPEEIVNWTELFIYVPYNFYDEIVKELKKHKMEELYDYTMYDETTLLSETEFCIDYKRSINSLKEKRNLLEKKCLLWGNFFSVRKGIYKEYFLKWKEKNTNLDFAFVSEDTIYHENEIEEEMEVFTIVAPKIFDYEVFVTGGTLRKEEYEYVESKEYLLDAVQRIKKENPYLNNNEVFYQVYYLEKYCRVVLDLLNPIQIIVYASTSTSHFILQSQCEEKNIPIIFTHPGIFPGTFAFDVGGEVGESLPTIHYDKFKKLPVSKEEVLQAQKVWNYIFQNKLNRKLQPKNECMEFIKTKCKEGRPKILFLGHHDSHAIHMVPYTQVSRKYHSPIFESSVDAGIYLAGLCKKNDWNFIYKPHPMYAKWEQKNLLPNNAIYVEFADINDLIDGVDVVITILSQSNYVSLFRYKPVVMLGYNQTKGKGCTYEAFEKSKIEKTIQSAIVHGFTQEQKENFLMHIAQLLKYYAYDDFSERSLRYGKEIPYQIDEFYELQNILK